MNSTNIVLISIYLILSLLIFIFLTKISYKLDLVDIPDKRKKHLKPTAFTGGLALSISYILAIYLFNFSSSKLDIILSMGFLIAIVGFIDDKYNLNVGGKLSLQTIPIIYLIILENFNLNQIGDYNNFKVELGSFSIPFSVMCVIFLINAFNYFDGLDGTLSFTSISTLCILIFLNLNHNNILFLIVIIIPIVIFLCFNFSIFKIPKLFLGDSGSLLLGFIISFTIIYFANKNFIHPILLSFSISIFVYEFISVNIIRLQNKKAIFSAGQDHLHYILFKKNNSLLQTNFIISAINVIFFVVGYLSYKIINPLASLILFTVCFIIYFFIRKKMSLNI
jgi:UDP-GlcNAc:undecaprenyl-phosphate/decaprenyl-phosphate GlcNAc-1-phosphate transferase